MNRTDHHHRAEPSLSGIVVFDVDGAVPLLVLLDAVNFRIVASVALPTHGGYNNHIGGKLDIRARWSRIRQHVSLVPEVAKVVLVVDDPIISLAITTVLHS